ncbi:leucine-rich repeat-containing protein [Paucimonas lemoignei]|nr:leucine-rich repeat-containing protein [Paucimonas lemoignei]
MTSTVDSFFMTSETWSDYQALELIETQLDTSLTRLSDDQRQRYLKLCRIEPQARQDLAEAIQSFKRDFEVTAYAELVELFRENTGQTLDLRNTWLHTRVLEMPQRKDAKDPIELLSSLFSSRAKRSLADDAPRERFMSTTLWQAAKDNFAFHLSSRLHSGLDFQRASAINTDAKASLSNSIENLSVTRCIDLVREYDFASRLRTALVSHLVTTLNPLIFAHRKASFELELLEALRSNTIPDDGHRLMAALTKENALKWQFFHIYFGWQLLPTPTTLPLPFCVLSLPDGSGVFSYFPSRPKGALRHHRTSTDAITSLREQICTDAKANRIDWLLRTLSLADQAILLSELKTTVVNENQLNWLAKQLYNAFHSRTPAAERIYIRTEINQPKPATHSLLTAMEMRQSLTLFQDLQSIARSTASKDWEQIKKTLLHIGSEILELLTLPAPGGVTGLNRLMITASLGTLTYNAVAASDALARGQSAEFVQALGDIAELMISSRAQMVGAKLSAQRTQHLIAAIGKPRAADMPNGDRRLWLPDLRPYTEIDSRLLSGLSAGPEGLFAKDGKTYARIQVDDQVRVGELTYDAELEQHRLKHPDAQQYQPVVRYEHKHNHWRLAPADVSHLTSTELLQTMLRPDMPTLSRDEVQYLQTLTQVSRTQLEAAWNGDAPIPWTLDFAIRDLHQRRAESLHDVTEQDNSTTSALRQRFHDLPEAAVRALVREHPALKDITRQTPLAPAQRAAIEQAQVQTRLIKVFNTLNDPKGRGMGADAEAVACNLLTALPGWPADMCIQVFQGAPDFNGGIAKTERLLGTYGDESAPHAVIIARLNDRYAGYDPRNQDMLQPQGTDYPLASALLRTLTDTQRTDLKYQLHYGGKLADAILGQAQIHSATLGDLLPAPTTFELSTAHLAAFQLAYDYSASKPDNDGLYSDDGKLYARIDGDFFQVLHDRDASRPGRKVMRIVRPGDPVAGDADNLYVASRPGRSEPITRDTQGLWVGAVTGLSGGAPKVDRLKAMREKALAERQQYISNELALQHVLSEFGTHFNQPASTTYFILAGTDYYQLKQMTHENLYVQVMRHRKAATTDFEELPPSIPLKRETLIRTVIELENVDHSYSRVSDLYQGISTVELQAMKSTGLTDLTTELEIPLYKPMQDANANVISLIERFRALVHDEIDRLLIKLDEFPVAPEPQTRRTPSPGKGRTPSKTKHSSTPPPATPKNRVEIVTQDNAVLTGKPRNDNPNIVDILDSRGQRKATYLRSSDGQYWVEHRTTSIPSPSASPAAPLVWESYDTAAQKLLKEAGHSESVADYLGRKKGSAPSAPEGLLEYHANRLDEHARDTQDMAPQLADEQQRQQALDKARELSEKARYLRQKGRTLRIDLVIANNAPVANDLQYLADSNNLSVRKTRQERIALERAGSSRQQTARDYIDEFELKIKDRNQVWAYAHLHYAELASDAAAFSAAHLKRPEQRFQGAQLQIQEAQAGRRYEIHRGSLEKAQVQDILLSERFS